MANSSSIKAAEIAELANYAAMYNQRLGQFIDNIIDDSSFDLFYVTDEELMNLARRYVQKYLTTAAQAVDCENAVHLVVDYCKESMHDHKYNDKQYEIVSVRTILNRLGYSKAETLTILQHIANQGFEYCLDSEIGSASDGGPYNQAVCAWGVDQILSRLEFTRSK